MTLLPGKKYLPSFCSATAQLGMAGRLCGGGFTRKSASGIWQKTIRPARAANEKKRGGGAVELVYDEVEFETESEWLLSFDENNVWLPKSQCEIDIGRGRVGVPAWLAREKGLEGYEV
jgi:hypothetical protein